jgi:hypothetical protein
VEIRLKGNRAENKYVGRGGLKLESFAGFSIRPGDMFAWMSARQRRIYRLSFARTARNE